MNHKILLARLAASDAGRPSEKTIRNQVAPLFKRAFGNQAGIQRLDETVESAIAEGLVGRTTHRKTIKLSLTEAGNKRAQQEFIGANTQTWATIRKTWLIAHALGVAEGLKFADVKVLSRVTVLRLVVINQYLRLGLPPIPTTKALDTALCWYGLEQGLRDDVLAFVRKRPPNLGLILAAIASSIGEFKTAEKPKALAQLAAKAVRARNAGNDLHEAVITYSLQSAFASPPLTNRHLHNGSTTNGKPKTGSLGTFAQKVLASARRAQTGKLDESLILINHAHAQFVDEHPDDATSLDEFKTQLWNAAMEGQLMLASADMPQLLDTHDYQASRINRGASIFALIRI